MRAAYHVAVGILRRGNEIALVLQGRPEEEGFWALPGGIVEEEELVLEGLVREVSEETGLTVELPPRLAYVWQLDNRRGEPLTPRHPSDGYLVTVWVFEVTGWSGELGARDPDGLVHEARFVPVAEAAQLLRRTPWLELPAAYLEGLVEPRSLHFERWNEDGSVSVL